MPRTVNPTYSKVAQTIARHQGVEFDTLPSIGSPDA